MLIRNLCNCFIVDGGISGGAYNPAVAIGINMMGLSAFSNIRIFLLGNFGGGALAALVYKAVNTDEDDIAKR